MGEGGRRPGEGPAELQAVALCLLCLYTSACSGTDARKLFVSTTCDDPGLARSLVAQGKHAWVTEEEASKVHRFDLSTCGVDSEWLLPLGPRAIALLPNGDFVTANRDAHALALGFPDGGMLPLDVAGSPASIAVGKLESAIVIATSVSYDDGDAGWGTFITEPLAPLRAESLSGATSVGLADLDGDGANEILVARSTEHVVTVFTPNGAGIDLQVCDEPFAVAPLPKRGAVVTCRSGGLVTLDGAAPGTTQQKLARDGTLYQTVAEDLDADGFVDLASVDPFAHKLVLWWGAKAGFGAPVELAVPEGPVALAVTDFDSDGDSDIVVLSLMAKKLAGVENPLRGKSR